MKRTSTCRTAGLWAAVLGLLALFVPATASAWWNHEWSYRKALTIDPGPAAAGAPSELAHVPVLIRLHDGVIRFADANADGSDLRFVAADDKTPLHFHVEKFDDVFSLAFVWVELPKLEAGKPAAIWMYYGNAKAGAAGDARGTYDPDQVLVYHFAERGTPPQDATGFANHAATSVASDDSGIVGTAARFDGQSRLALPGSASLALAAGAPMTWSAWIKPAAAGQTAVLFARHDGARALRIGLAGGAPYVAVAGDDGREQRSPAGAALDDAWHHLALVAGEQLRLYVDGRPGPVLEARLPALSGPSTLGADAPAAAGGAPAAATDGFAGQVDELQIAKAARSPAFVRLLALNEGGDDKLVAFGADEQLSTWSSGYLAIILRSVTLDGWVVIGLLGVMAVISWSVMISKTRHLNRVTRANRAFNGVFRELGGDLAALGRLDAAAAGPAAAPLTGGAEVADERSRRAVESPLYHLYTAGMAELRRRIGAADFTGEAGRADVVHLSGQSIEAIRATLDSNLVEETQNLNRNMVLLTIAISGGPFLGLLGTVVGVMITFAAIAAAGDVNVNAIAPGISAALVATVAGLLVAIPALFGYNYLLTRIKEASAHMQVFLDAFVTRMAENHHRPAVLQPAPSQAAALPTAARA